MAKSDLIRATVAPGRTVYAKAVTTKQAMPGQNDLVNVTKAIGAAGPGDVVELSADEVERLRGLGFLLPADAEPIALVQTSAQGPTFETTEGPSISSAAE